MEPEKLPRNDFQQAAFDAGKNAMKDFMEKTHTAGYHKHLIEGMVDGFVREHRTIQQETVSFFVDMLVAWGKLPQSHISDLRNEATYHFAQKLANEHNYFPFI